MMYNCKDTGVQGNGQFSCQLGEEAEQMRGVINCGTVALVRTKRSSASRGWGYVVANRLCSEVRKSLKTRWRKVTAEDRFNRKGCKRLLTLSAISGITLRIVWWVSSRMGFADSTACASFTYSKPF